MITKETKVTKSMGLVDRIIAALKGGDETNVVKFFEKERKRCNTAIKKLKHNLAAEKSQYDIAKEQLAEQLEDANDAVLAAYENVIPENVTNNAARETFSSSYWEGVSSAEATVESIESSTKNLTEAFNEGGTAYVDGNALYFVGKKSLNDQITKRNARIEKIS